MPTQPESQKFLEAGDVLHERYRIEELIGVGGMGAVYAARDTVSGEKRVAVESTMIAILDPKRRSNAVKNFEKEARMLAALRHPSLVTFHDYFVEGGNQYLVMDLVIGQTLADIQEAAGGALDPRVVFGWVQQVCEVLEYLHSHDPPILMRDLKPENIMLNREDKIVLIDLGLARIHSPDSQTSISLKGLGTTGYAPAEQYYGGTDPRSDIYSLGATMYFLMTGTMPPPSVKRVAEGLELVGPRRLNSALPVSCEVAILKMMKLGKNDRFQSIVEVKEELKKASRDLSMLPPLAPIPTGFWATLRAKTSSSRSLMPPASSRSRFILGIVVLASLAPTLLWSLFVHRGERQFLIRVPPPHSAQSASALERDLAGLNGVTLIMRPRRAVAAGMPDPGVVVELTVAGVRPLAAAVKVVEAHHLILGPEITVSP